MAAIFAPCRASSLRGVNNPMKQIKTVTAPMERAEWFDNAVNALLADGWVISKRDILHVPGALSESFNAPVVQMLYAELELWEPIPFEESTL